MGDEEFVVLAPQVGAAGAAGAAERLCAAVAAYDFGEVGRVTVSLGVAEYLPGESLDDLFSRADQALYVAKESGRDRVEIAGRAGSAA